MEKGTRRGIIIDLISKNQLVVNTSRELPAETRSPASVVINSKDEALQAE